jgi:hypothetical protein|tara:strand:- start:441 stop:644 length:204 start_codon:yes stop_codon:yes gene_type:complete
MIARTLNTLGLFLVVAGILVMAGSANDCDGACVEQANTLGEMALVMFAGMLTLTAGAIILLKSDNNG